uniref:Uncharacterized protein n=1 Tax=Ciona intestinalis TaxID=7719 RepID=H2XTT3_CIOIN
MMHQRIVGIDRRAMVARCPAAIFFRVDVEIHLLY